MNLLIAAVIYFALVGGAAWLVRYHDRLARERDVAEHERWMARQQESEAVLIRQRLRETEAHREILEAQVAAAHRIHNAFHPDDREPWQRDA